MWEQYAEKTFILNIFHEYDARQEFQLGFFLCVCCWIDIRVS